jgi:MOSC domain-containing protein YiiM
MATVASLHVSEASMRPMRSVDAVTLVPGVGVEGDRYATGRGTYVAFREPGRQLTLISGDGAASAVAGLPRRVSVPDLRRNVVVTGMTAAELASAIGAVVRVGDECEVFVHRLCVPCLYNERLNRAPGLMEAVWEAGGVNCEILRGGVVRVGDGVAVVPGSRDASRVDDGGKKAAFYKRPSLRTEDERRSLAAAPNPEKPGMDRIMSAYASVGAGEALGLTDAEVERLTKRARRRDECADEEKRSRVEAALVRVALVALSALVVLVAASLVSGEGGAAGVLRRIASPSARRVRDDAPL